MKRSILIHELTDWIENLDHDAKLDIENIKDLQNLLLRCRKELMNNSNDVEKPESELQRQVKTEIAKQKSKLGIKE